MRLFYTKSGGTLYHRNELDFKTLSIEKGESKEVLPLVEYIL